MMLMVMIEKVFFLKTDKGENLSDDARNYWFCENSEKT